MRRRGRVDKTQPELVKKLRDNGKSVAVLSPLGGGIPDLLIAGASACPHCKRKFPQNILIEVKEAGGTLTEDEQRFFLGWIGPKAVWTVFRQGNNIIVEENGQLVQLNGLPQGTRVPIRVPVRS